MNPKLNREELAALEIGHTCISGPLSRIMSFAFLLLIFSVPLLQFVFDEGHLQGRSVVDLIQTMMKERSPGDDTGLSLFSRINRANTALLQGKDDLEQQLEEGSFLRSNLLGPGQRLLLGLGYGNEKVYPGKELWLFYRPDMDYLMGPPFLDPIQLEMRRKSGKTWEASVQPDPIQAIVSFKDELGRRGIELILMPTPIKASIHPEMFAAGEYPVALQNRSWKLFMHRLDAAGIHIFDPAPILMEYKRANGTGSYLKTDTHWLPGAMATVAKRLAAIVEKSVALSQDQNGLQVENKHIANRGDIDSMLRLPPIFNDYPEQEVPIQTIVTSSREMWQGMAGAEVLLLGDSFSNIYSLSSMSWGEGAGFAEHLSYNLRRPLDMILQNDSGAYATRALLARELSRGRDRLAGKKVVIWQFAARELASGDWKEIPMELKEPRPSEFYIPESGETRKVRATLIAVSRSPVAGSVPYKDNIITLHIADITDIESGEEYGQAVVYAWGMRDNIMQALSGKRAGDELLLQLTDWDTVQGEYSSLRRSTLDDEILELELPVWGEILP
jgi:alginate O-acetyltransferase complex protein AlgJ